MVAIQRASEMDEEERNQPQHVAVRNARERRESAGPRNIPDAKAIIKNLDHLLRIWEMNRQYRLRGIAGSREDRMRGLFGGGR